MSSLHIVATCVLVVGACGSPDDDGENPDDPDLDARCSSLFRQDVLTDWRVTIAPQEWAALEDEFLHRAEREIAGLDPHPYHPVELEYDGDSVPDVLLRLKGQSSWWQAIELDPEPKMQFVIAFNEIDPMGRLHGVRKVELDMPRTDGSFLRQRLALYFMRRAGIDAQCANSARLFVNGEYYGLYTNLERPDKEYLQRVFGDADDGDLWRGAYTIETNEDSYTTDRIDAFWDAATVAELEALVDLDYSVRVWAAEAVVPHSDGYYNGRPNYLLYDHPERGFVWLPDDVDSAFDFSPADLSPLFPACDGRWPPDRWHWSMVMADELYRSRYVEALAALRADYDVAVLQARVDAWSVQIADAAAADPNKPFSTGTHRAAIASLRAYIPQRAAYVDQWLACRADGGDDVDGDGFAYCDDCNDADADARPDAVEVCNGVDDNCDGLADATLDWDAEPICP